MRTAAILLLLLGLTGCTRPKPLPWWKGNLHTHSLWSDGDDYPEMIASWYKSQGYHFLALSDHNILSDHERWLEATEKRAGGAVLDKYLARFGQEWVERRSMQSGQEVRLKMLSEFRGLLEEPGRFLMIQSEEITGRYLTAPIHINATNIVELINPPSGRSILEVMQKTVDAVAEQRQRTGVPMFSHINHPNFGWAITAEELMQLDNERFFEVYNGHPLVHNDGDELRAGMDRVWDIILAHRLEILNKEAVFGIATDDAHDYHDLPGKRSKPGRGWVMVRAANLSTNDLIAAMEAGDFYSSTGVTLKEVKRSGRDLAVEIEEEQGVTYLTEFIGTRKDFDRTSSPVLNETGTPLRATRRYSSQIGAVLAAVEGRSASYSLKGDEIYVRARVTSSKRKENPSREGEMERAWTQPLLPPNK